MRFPIISDYELERLNKFCIFKKTELLKFTTGCVIDLVTNDVQRLEEHTVMWGVSALLDFFLLVTIIGVLLVYFVGWQALMGVTCLFLLVPYFAELSLRLCCTTPEDSSVFRQPHIFVEPGYFWDSCHQNTCIGG